MDCRFLAAIFERTLKNNPRNNDCVVIAAVTSEKDQMSQDQGQRMYLRGKQTDGVPIVGGWQGYDEILITSDGVSCTEIITPNRRWHQPGITRCADGVSDKRNNRRKSGTGLCVGVGRLALAVSNRTR